MEFNELRISGNIVSELASNGIKKPTSVQEKVIPLVINKKDVIVQSETGSGKTISFAAPTIDLITPQGAPQVLVLAPTRELAIQISEQYQMLSRHKNLKVAQVYGGASFKPQIKSSRVADVIVGTPGRLLDLLQHGEIKLSKVKHFILDEADRLMDMGFIDDIDRIIKFIPKERQNLMFSATINSRIIELSNKYMKSPEKVLLNNVLSKNVMKQIYYDVNVGNDKTSLLIHLLKKDTVNLKLVFCNTKRKTEELTRVLKEHGIDAGYHNGDMTQANREKRIKDFDNGRIKVLVATDIAARGLDIEGITEVYNYNLPREIENYSHRIGRTARNGAKGVAITLLSKEDYPMMDILKKKMHFDIINAPKEKYEIVSSKNKLNRRKESFSRKRF